jgi:thiosulfate/3-mercaptopyruvate sulfurtransferase
VVLDISPNTTRFIEGSINLNYEEFLDQGWKLKPVPEIAALLGKAGISSNDSVVIAGECLPCGGGPSPAAFSYWALRYLGHEKVRILDVSIEDWEAAGLNTSEDPAIRPETTYTPALRPELLATYDFVVNGGAQIVDARPARDFSTGSIPGAINIPYSEVMEDNRIRQEEDIRKTFAKLEKDTPVIVYTNVGVEASLVWLALTLSGYDARLYSLSDWLENQPAFGYELVDVEAKPNPVRRGRSTTITATFQERQTESTEEPLPNGEVRLRVMQCAGCGFGSQDIFANLDRKDGIVQVGYAGKASGDASQGSLRCTAVISSSGGQEAARMSLLRTSANKYMGIWSADVAPGVYRLSILASTSGNSTTFPDVLEIEVTD